MLPVPLDLPTPLVHPDWLAGALGHPDLVVIDASWYLTAMGRDARQEYERAHVPGAVFWDLDALSDTASPLPHMLPAAADFAREVGGLGIGSGHAVVVYDGSGNNLSAPRVWWTFRVFGHDRVAVLDGGFAAWMAAGHAVEGGSVRRPAARFDARFRSDMVRSLEAMRSLVSTGGAQVLDARGRGRFAGSEPEPRAGVRSGHHPGARNLPYGELVGPDGAVLPAAELERRLRGAGIDLSRPVVTTCGSGVTACALALALDLVGHSDYAVYDGSWTEWATRSDTPVDTGPPA